MPTPRKYFGPCDVHVVYTKRCKHCDGWATHLRRIGQPQQQPRAKRLGTTGKTFRFQRHRRRGQKRYRWPLLTLPHNRSAPIH